MNFAVPSCLCGACRKCKQRAASRRWYDRNLRKDPSVRHPNFGKRYNINRVPIPPELLGLTEIDAAWVAGILEGEGSFIIERRQGRRVYVNARISMNSTDLDVIVKLHGLVGGRWSVEPQAPPRKTQWKWQFQGYDASCVLCERILPYMCERRSGQIRSMLAAVAAARLTA